MSNVDISRPSTLTTGLSIYPKNIHFKATSFSDSPCTAAARRPCSSSHCPWPRWALGSHWVLFTIKLFQVGVFIYEAVLLSAQGVTMGPNGPVYIQAITTNDNKSQENLNSRASSSWIHIKRKKSGGSWPTCLFIVASFTSHSMSSFRLVQQSIIIKATSNCMFSLLSSIL